MQLDHERANDRFRLVLFSTQITQVNKQLVTLYQKIDFLPMHDFGQEWSLIDSN